MIQTTDGRIITDLTGAYVKVGGTSKYVYTDRIVMGTTMAGPTFDKANWAMLNKAQRAKAEWNTAIRKQTRWYKASRYDIVNHTASEARIQQMIGWMNAAQRRADAAEALIESYGIRFF